MITVLVHEAPRFDDTTTTPRDIDLPTITQSRDDAHAAPKNKSDVSPAVIEYHIPLPITAVGRSVGSKEGVPVGCDDGCTVG